MKDIKFYLGNFKNQQEGLLSFFYHRKMFFLSFAFGMRLQILLKMKNIKTLVIIPK